MHVRLRTKAYGLVILLGALSGTACVPEGANGRQLLAGVDPSDPDGGTSKRPDTGVGRDAGPPPDLGPAIEVDPVYDDCPSYAYDFEIPVEVTEEQNPSTPRDPTVTKVLVPFGSETQLYSLNGLAVFDGDGRRLPAQFETLSRYTGAPDDCGRAVRYAYAHIRATPPPGGTASWSIRATTDTTEETHLNISESAEQWVIETGPARFTVRRDRFDGLKKVELLEGGGFRTIVENAAFMLDHGQSLSAGNLAPWRLELERRGPQVVTVAARGFYAPADGTRDLAYTIRLHFYSDSSVVRIEHTYYHGRVNGAGVESGDVLTQVDRAYLTMPLSFSPTRVAVRALDQTHELDGSAAVALAQKKRTSQAQDIRFELVRGGQAVENGGLARRPGMLADDGARYVMATVGRMAEREPQGLRYDPAGPRLELDFTSEPISVGGARGIWSEAAIDFGTGSPDAAARFDTLQLQAERPLLGRVGTAYLNGTRTLGPYAETEGSYAPYFDILRQLHSRTKQYLEDSRITGLQIWPDMPRQSCIGDGVCASERSRLYEGGDNNYWNWSKPGIDEFFRTGNNEYIYAFSLGEATTFAETLAFRLDHDQIYRSPANGLAPCFGSSRAYGGPWQEGLNNRVECVADYTYDKTIKLAYLATADRRFVDYAEEAGLSAVDLFGVPPEPSYGEELSFVRLSEQRLELVAVGAEFSRDPEVSGELRNALELYVDTMLSNVLLDGHTCQTTNSGSNSAFETGECFSGQAWMHGTQTEWTLRVSRFLEHEGLRQWIVQHGAIKAKHHTVLGANGLPDYSRRSASSATDSENGWRTMYGCAVDANGVEDNTCRKVDSNFENDGYFYDNDLLGFLNVFGIVLAADPSDPDRTCEWVPSIYVNHLTRLDPYAVNDYVWGKRSGLSLGMSPEAVGALSAYCP